MATTYTPDNVKVITGATTLKLTDNGKLCLLSAAAGDLVTLPPLERGFSIEFVVATAFATSNWVIASSEGDNIDGLISDMGSTPAVVLASGEDQINFVASAETIGDSVKFIADTTNSKWIARGTCGANGGMTATDPS